MGEERLVVGYLREAARLKLKIADLIIGISWVGLGAVR